jgi:hypothetical protein
LLLPSKTRNNLGPPIPRGARKTGKVNMAKSNISPRQETEMPATRRVTRQCGGHRITVTAEWIERLELFALRVVANGELFDTPMSDDLDTDIPAIIGDAFLELEFTGRV